MKNRISSWIVPRMKVLIVADLMNSQTQYFDNLISKLRASVLKNENTVIHHVCQCKCLVSSYIP